MFDKVCMFNRCVENGGNLDGISPTNDAERTLDHWTFARRSLCVLIILLNFPSQLKFAPHLARN